MFFRPTFSRNQKSSRAWVSRQFRDSYVKQRLSDPASYRARSAFKLLEINAQWDHFLTKSDVRDIVDLGAAPGGWSQVVAGQLGWTTEMPKKPPGGYIYEGRSKDRLEDRGTWSKPTFPPLNKGRGNDPLFDPLDVEYPDAGIQPTGRGTIVAVDLLRLQPISGVHTVQADFLSPETEALIRGLLSVNGNPDGKADVILSDMAANMSGNQIHDVESSLMISTAVFEFAKRNLRSAESIGRRRGGVLL